jgi:hypothetical protein
MNQHNKTTPYNAPATPTPPPRPPLEPVDPDLAPDPALSADASPAQDAARQQFIHGLLTYLNHDRPPERARRVHRVMAALHPAPALSGLAGTRRRLWRTASGLAAAAIIALGVFVAWPTTPTAFAMLETSVEAARKAGDRRYEVRALVPSPPPPPSSTPGPSNPTSPTPTLTDLPIATIDIRSADRYVVRATTPRGERVAFGRDANGEWSVAPDGSTDRADADRRRPRWIDLGESTIFLESIDSIIESLPKAFEPKRLNPAPLPPGPTGSISATGSTTGSISPPGTTPPSPSAPLFNRVSAARPSGPAPTPQPGPSFGPPGGPPGGPPATGPQRIELWIDPATNLVARMELHFPDPLRRPEGHRPEGREGGPKPDARDSGPKPEGREGGPNRRGPGGPPGPRPDGAPDAGPHRHGPPRFLDGPPDFAAGRHAPPPRVIIFLRAPAPPSPLPDSWFSPQSHGAKPN